jgi:hypothetical protein
MDSIFQNVELINAYTPYITHQLMDLMMRNGILQSVLCLIGLHGPSSCLGQLNWKNRKHVHHNNTLHLGKIITTGDDLNYFANSLSNEKNFVKNLDTILIPRTVGSANHKKVREVSIQ